MTFNGWTFAFEIINFLVLAYILQRLVYRPLHAAVDKRRQTIEQAQADAEQARQDAAQQRKLLEAQLAGTEEQRQTVLAEARQEAEAQREHILTEAAHETERRTVVAREALSRERDEALRSLHVDIVQEAVRLAERLLQDASGTDLDAQLARHVADTVRTLSPKEQERLTRSLIAGETATLETAHDLTPQAVEQVREAVAGVLGQGVALRVQTVPELVSGVRLRLNGNVWDASLAGQLEGIGDEVGHDAAR